MGWKHHAAWITLLVACLEVGLSVNPPHARSAHQCFRGREGRHQVSLPLVSDDSNQVHRPT